MFEGSFHDLFPGIINWMDCWGGREGELGREQGFRFRGLDRWGDWVFLFLVRAFRFTKNHPSPFRVFHNFNNASIVSYSVLSFPIKIT